MSHKVVHVTRLSGAKYALCSHKVDYSSSTKTGLTEGWCVVDYMKEYQISALYTKSPWEFCKNCLEAPDYALYLLGAA